MLREGGLRLADGVFLLTADQQWREILILAIGLRHGLEGAHVWLALLSARGVLGGPAAVEPLSALLVRTLLPHRHQGLAVGARPTFAGI